MKEDDLIQTIAQMLYDKKAANILALDVRSLGLVTDYFIIAEGGVERHVTALAKHLTETLKKEDIYTLHEEGIETGDWAVLDYGEVIIHILRPDMRQSYALEELWREGKIVELHLDLKSDSKVL